MVQNPLCCLRRKPLVGAMFVSVLLGVGFVSFLLDVRVSGCDETCTDKPTFTPARLVVKYGDPTSAACLVCGTGCPQNLFGLEKSVGVHSVKGPEILWTVDKMTEWEPSPKCYYNVGAKKCCSTLPVTVYKPPDSVSISFDKGSDQMIEGQSHLLKCTVENVAPVGNVTVTFYRGKNPMSPPVSSRKLQKSPVTEVFTANLTPTKDDNSIAFWCEVKLELGPEGPKPPLVVKSSKLIASVDSSAMSLIPSLSLCFMIAVMSLV